MPREGGKSVVQDLNRRFPDMMWLQGNELHRSKHDVKHEWLPLESNDDVGNTVVRVLQEDMVVTQGIGHALVFCNDTASASSLHATLQAVRITIASV